MGEEQQAERVEWVAVRVPTAALERVWATMNAKRGGRRQHLLSRSQVVTQALNFLGAFQLGHPGLVPTLFVLPPGEPTTEVYVPQQLLLDCGIVMGSHDLYALANTALTHAVNSLEAHGHLLTRNTHAKLITPN